MGTARNAKARVAQYRHIAPIIREAFINAVQNLKMRGKPLEKLIEQSLEDNPIGMLKAMSHFAVKEVKIDESKHYTFEFHGLPGTYEFIKSIKAKGVGAALPESMQDGSLLPAKVRDDEEGSGT